MEVRYGCVNLSYQRTSGESAGLGRTDQAVVRDRAIEKVRKLVRHFPRVEGCHLTVGRTDNPDVSRMTIVLDSETANAYQVEKNLIKLVNVIRVDNVTDKRTLYNFLSTFSGTHYVTPRALTAELGFHF